MLSTSTLPAALVSTFLVRDGRGMALLGAIQAVSAEEAEELWEKQALANAGPRPWVIASRATPARLLSAAARGWLF